MENDTIQGVAHATNKSVLYALHDGDGFGVYAVGKKAGVYGQSAAGPGVNGVSSAADGVEGAASAAGKSGVYAHHSGDGWGVYGVGNRAGVYGKSSLNSGVEGFSSASDGVTAHSTAENKSGVYAFNDSDKGYGVYARGGAWGAMGVAKDGIGVQGSGQTGVVGFGTMFEGVNGQSFAADGKGVFGYCGEPGGVGCLGSGRMAGVAGYTDYAAGTGVHAENTKGGLGLDVVGKTKLQRSGVAATVVGKAYRAVTVPGGVTAASKYLVTMQGNPGAGVFVAYAKHYSVTQFRVYFNKACTAAVNFAWMVLD